MKNPQSPNPSTKIAGTAKSRFGEGPELLTTKEAARLLGLSQSTLNKLRVYGGGPRYLKLTRRVRYSIDDLNSWLNDRRRNSTSEAA